MLSKGKEIVTGKGKNKVDYSNASSGLRKRKNSVGVLRFLDIAADVADRESDSSSIDSYTNDHSGMHVTNHQYFALSLFRAFYMFILLG